MGKTIQKTEVSESRIRKVIFSEATMVATIVGITVGVIGFFLNPAKQNASDLAALKQQLAAHEQEMQKQDDIAARIQNIKDNDLHTIEGKVEQNRIEVESMKVEITKLQTIIEERIPKKK